MIAAVVTIAAIFCIMILVIAGLVSQLRKSRGVVVDIVSREVEKNIIKAAENAKLKMMDSAEKQIKVLQGDSAAELERKLNE